MDKFSYKVFQFSTQEKLIKPGNKILVSISGGIDSMSLFCLLNTFRKKIDIDLHLIHFNHGLRAESEEEETFLQKMAEKKSIPISFIRADHLRNKKGMQNRARKWRYDHLNEILKKLNFDKIALGHHLNDLMETQIWKLLRGGSLFSMNPIQLENPPYIRPLLYTRKSELKEYLISIDQEWREDKSNFSNDYTRNHIRNEIVPLMKESAGDRLEDKFLALNEDSLHLKQYFNTIIPPETYEKDTLSFETISNLNPLFARELIHQFLIFHSQEEINRANIRKIHELVKSNKGNWQVVLKNKRCVLGKNKKIRLV